MMITNYLIAFIVILLIQLKSSQHISALYFRNSIRIDTLDLVSPKTSVQIAATEDGSVYIAWNGNNLQFKEILNRGSLFGKTIQMNSNFVLPSSLRIIAIEKGDIYLIWIDLRSEGSSDSILQLKRISETFFDRNQ